MKGHSTPRHRPAPRLLRADELSRASGGGDGAPTPKAEPVYHICPHDQGG